MLLQYTCSTCMNSTLHTDIESNDHRCAICGKILKDKKEVGPKLINLQDITTDTPGKLDRDKTKKTTIERDRDKPCKTSEPSDRDLTKKALVSTDRSELAKSSSNNNYVGHAKSPGNKQRDNKQRIIEKIVDDKIYFKE